MQIDEVCLLLCVLLTRSATAVLCLDRGSLQMCHFRSRVCDTETRAPSRRLDKPHALDAQKETDKRWERSCGFGIHFLLENRLVLITNPPIC